MKKCVIFDLDGTLMDAYPAVISSINYTLNKCGFAKSDPAVIRRSVGWGDRRLLRGFVGEINLKKALAIYRAHHLKALRTGVKLLPGARKVLRQLKEDGYLLAIASNRPTRFSLIALKCLMIRKYFDYVLCADQVKKGKPSPILLRQIIKKLAVKPRYAVYVGDMDIDVMAGNRAGIKTIAVLTGSCSRTELKALKPAKIVKNVSFILGLV